MSIFTVEQPPEEESEGIQAYLRRMFVKVKNEFSITHIFEPGTALPARPAKGGVYYFDNAILPEILWPGWWGWMGTKWVPIDSAQNTLALYGAILLGTPVVIGTVNTTWITVPFDTASITNPKGIVQDIANDKLIVPYKGVYRIGVNIVISHDELNAGREAQFALFSPSNNWRSAPLVFGTGRNVGVTNMVSSFLFEIINNAIGNDLQIQINSAADTYLATTVEFAGFNINSVSEEQV